MVVLNEIKDISAKLSWSWAWAELGNFWFLFVFENMLKKEKSLKIFTSKSFLPVHFKVCIPSKDQCLTRKQ